MTVNFVRFIMGLWLEKRYKKPDPDTLYPCQRYFIA
nr:MAG TPA: accessory protein [Caudoviricetes sp.]